MITRNFPAGGTSLPDVRFMRASPIPPTPFLSHCSDVRIVGIEAIVGFDAMKSMCVWRGSKFLDGGWLPCLNRLPMCWK